MQYISCILQIIYYICCVENIKLKLARVEKGLSQQELANLCEVTRQTIGLVEKGKYNPTLNLCIKIATVLDLTLNDLFWDENKRK
jgi:putative transcriptional regulator